MNTNMEFQGLQLASVPIPSLIIKMSRSNGTLVFHRGILPNLVLDISNFMANTDFNEQIPKMYLVAVIVLRSLHYTAFVRDGIKTSSEWYYFDSLPSTVVKCTTLGNAISEMEKSGLENLGKAQGDLDQIIRDNHICIYFSPQALKEVKPNHHHQMDLVKAEMF